MAENVWGQETGEDGNARPIACRYNVNGAVLMRQPLRFGDGSMICIRQIGCIDGRGMEDWRPRYELKYLIFWTRQA